MRKYLSILLCLILSGCNAKTTQPEIVPSAVPDSETESEFVNPDPADMSGYAGFNDENHVYMEITLEESLNKARNGEKFMVYYGNDHCPWCTEVVPVLNEVAKEKQVLVYYVDTSKPSNYSEDLYERLLELFGDTLEMNENGERTFYVPDVAVIADQGVIMNHIATVDTHDPYEKPMTGTEKKQLKEIYSEMMDQLK